MKLQVFVWSDLFETGVELIDSQHQALVDLINQLGEGVMQDRPDRAGDVLERFAVDRQQDIAGDETGCRCGSIGFDAAKLDTVARTLALDPEPADVSPARFSDRLGRRSK